jgi:hypothetical protein
MMVLNNALDNMKSRALKNAICLNFEHINRVLLRLREYEEANFKELKFYFTLLRHIIQLVDQMQDVKARSELKKYIFNHPSLGHLRNEMTKDISLFKGVTSGFPSDANLTVSILDMTIVF